MAADRVQTLRPLPVHPKITLGLSTAIDTNMTQNGGQQSCTESPEELEKASMQVSELLCNLLKTSQVPQLGLEEVQQSSGSSHKLATTGDAFSLHFQDHTAILKFHLGKTNLVGLSKGTEACQYDIVALEAWHFC